MKARMQFFLPVHWALGYEMVNTGLLKGQCHEIMLKIFPQNITFFQDLESKSAIFLTCDGH
jgi:hypothetical protein